MEFIVKRIYFHAASVFLSRVLVVAESSDRDLELLQITKKQKTKKTGLFMEDKSFAALWFLQFHTER